MFSFNFNSEPKQIDLLRRDVLDKNMLFEVRLKTCLAYMHFHPEEKAKTGCFWFCDDIFAINSRILGMFLNLKPNSINKNLRSRYFERIRPFDRTKFFTLPDYRNWNVLRRNYFNKEYVIQNCSTFEEWKEQVLPNLHKNDSLECIRTPIQRHKLVFEHVDSTDIFNITDEDFDSLMKEDIDTDKIIEDFKKLVEEKVEENFEEKENKTQDSSYVSLVMN